jgi:hypothetical protein
MVERGGEGDAVFDDERSATGSTSSARPSRSATVRERSLRPALVPSARGFNAVPGCAILAIVTRAADTSRPDDHAITDLGQAGLPAASHVRLKPFTPGNHLVIRQSGALSAADVAGFGAAAAPVLW